MDNCVASSKNLLLLIGVRSTNDYLEDSVLSHPDHPSLLSISDTLVKYKVESLAVKVDADRLDRLPLPFIAQVSNHGQKSFYTLCDISAAGMRYYDDKGRPGRMPRERFLEIWTGIGLLAGRTENSSEPGIEKKLAAKRMLDVLKVSALSLLTIWAVLQFANVGIIGDASSAIYVGLYTLLKIMGVRVGALLLWFDVDQYNPTLQSICSGGEKVNCRTVLDSRYARY